MNNSHFGDDYPKFHELVKSGKIVIDPKFKEALDKVVDRLKKKIAPNCYTFNN